MRQIATFPIDDLAFWKKQLLHWAASYEFGIYLDSHGPSPQPLECMAAADAMRLLEQSAGTAFQQLGQLQQATNNDWLFGYFGYDLKNETERLFSHNPDGIGLPDLGFFNPKTVVMIRSYQHAEHREETLYTLEIQTVGDTPQTVFDLLKNLVKQPTGPSNAVTLQARIPKADYLQTVETIRQHIAGGDIYELNFCQEFFAENVQIAPLAVFERLNAIGQAPFSTFLRWREHYLLSASPERFLKKTGQQLLSQPIKGTRRRGNTPEEDELIRQELANSEKDRSENVMIVDLVRNDFSRNCLPGSVLVDELCGIYTFATVHQMISTVRGELAADSSQAPADGSQNDGMNAALRALRDCFPMGSMTGAPKVMAMALIEQYERTRRGLYSGAVGYFAPDGDFDFNVVIRSILYNAPSRYVSAQVGGAIVYDSVPEQEYEECLTKVGAMMRALSGV